MLMSLVQAARVELRLTPLLRVLPIPALPSGIRKDQFQLFQPKRVTETISCSSSQTWLHV